MHAPMVVVFVVAFFFDDANRVNQKGFLLNHAQTFRRIQDSCQNKLLFVDLFHQVLLKAGNFVRVSFFDRY
jgi:hypothetical protein